MSVSFRYSAGFGKRMEYKFSGEMLMEGLDCYVPLVDDHGVDCIIKKSNGSFIEVQIKARTKEVTDGDTILFSAIIHDYHPNFYFIFNLKEIISDRRYVNGKEKTLWNMSYMW